MKKNHKTEGKAYENIEGKERKYKEVKLIRKRGKYRKKL